MSVKQELVSQHQIEIKPLNIQDIEKFDPILRQHVRDRNTGEILENEITQIKGYMKGEPDEYGRTRKYFVAKSIDGQVLGCMGYTTMDPDMVKHFSDLNPETTAELVNAFVNSEVFRGGGVGRKLFESVCTAAKTEGKTHLTVNSGPRYKDSWGFYDHMFDENKGMIIEKYGQDGNAKTWLKKL